MNLHDTTGSFGKYSNGSLSNQGWSDSRTADLRKYFELHPDIKKEDLTMRYMDFSNKCLDYSYSLNSFNQGKLVNYIIKLYPAAEGFKIKLINNSKVEESKTTSVKKVFNNDKSNLENYLTELYETIDRSEEVWDQALKIINEYYTLIKSRFYLNEIGYKEGEMMN